MTKRRAAMERLLSVEPIAANPGGGNPGANSGGVNPGGDPGAPAGTKAAPGGGEARSRPAPPTRSGAVRTMGLALDRITDPAATREAVIELDTALLDPSFVRDRLDEAEPEGAEDPADLDPTGLAALAQSIAEGGQAVPILVRPHPAIDGRYQIAYGHRRWLACKALGRPVRAIVRRLDDEALVLAQGRENNARRDLTFIERAQFAAALVARGMARPTVGKAIGVDKSELARLLAVANGLPEGLAPLIGRAPKAGRPRWLRLVELCRSEGDDAAFTAAAAAAPLPTDDRFKTVFDALTMRRNAARALETPPPPPQPEGAPMTVARGPGRTVITIDSRKAPDFAAYVEERLAALYREFCDGKR
ncbi:plasmid partitioning protein RepB [Acuticoccus sp. I52.16.1]|uniref:plasmid partitioning protein RepB n=1 Tax=Acuticoccus sp. I52.16.1 TaxID=2928472 RepID=UPI001FD4DE5C|nr:plasmid partitioning protein RepB [Acuticoccus sp. I52.16.1]UOM37362.1 plasmid partitioning protein RepB [Acuticoccus sp. I52.16.1]